MALTDNLLCALNMDEGTGTNAADSVGSFTGTLTNGATWAAAQSGSAVSCDGTDDYVSVAAGGGLNNLQTGSFALWVRWSGTQDVGNSVYGAVTSRQEDSVFSNHILGLDTNDPATGKLVFRLYDLAVAISGGTAVGEATWRHIVITYASGSQTLYLNGSSDGTGTATGTVSNNASIPLSLGAWIAGGGSYSTSRIHSFYSWSRVITPTEVTQLYNGGNRFSYPFPLGDQSALPSHFAPHFQPHFIPHFQGWKHRQKD